MNLLRLAAAAQLCSVWRMILGLLAGLALCAVSVYGSANSPFGVRGELEGFDSELKVHFTSEDLFTVRYYRLLGVVGDIPPALESIEHQLPRWLAREYDRASNGISDVKVFEAYCAGWPVILATDYAVYYQNSELSRGFSEYFAFGRFWKTPRNLRWLPLMILTLVPTILCIALRWMVYFHRARNLRCVTCAYSMLGVTRCPECGWNSDQSSQ